MTQPQRASSRGANASGTRVARSTYAYVLGSDKHAHVVNGHRTSGLGVLCSLVCAHTTPPAGLMHLPPAATPSLRGAAGMLTNLPT